MYPNSILTYRLQPTAIVSADTCAACDCNQPESQCQLKTHWTWRGDYIPASASEIRQVRQQLEVESFAPAVAPAVPVQSSSSSSSSKWQKPSGAATNAAAAAAAAPAAPATGAAGAPRVRRTFVQLSAEEQDAELRKRLKTYSQTAYKKSHVEVEEERSATVCQRENSFYVDTVRAFRDRRYEYKQQHKVWQANLSAAKTLDEERNHTATNNDDIIIFNQSSGNICTRTCTCVRAVPRPRSSGRCAT